MVGLRAHRTPLLVVETQLFVTRCDTVNVRYPYGFDASGHTAACDDADHIEQMLEQLLFLTPANG